MTKTEKDQNYYQFLGVAINATIPEITKAFRRKAKQYHPDTCNRCDAEDMFYKLSESYQTLKDPVKRQAYDAVLMGEIFQETVVDPAAARFTKTKL